MTTATKKTAAKKTPIDVASLDVGEVTSAPTAFTSGLSADHPLHLAFNKSVEEDGPVHIVTKTPIVAKALLRKLAKTHGLGLDSKSTTNGLAFRVRPLRERHVTPKPVETAVDTEL